MTKANNFKKTLLALQIGIVCCLGLASSSFAKAPPSKLQSLNELSTKAPSFRQLNIQEWKTTAGSKVLFVEAHELPMFDVRLTFAAGSSQEQTKDQQGVALLTSSMLNEGVEGMDVTAIMGRFEQVGASFSTGSYRDMAVVGLRTLSEPQKQQIALEMFTKVIGQPTFPETPFKRIKNQLLTGFEIQKKTPKSLLNKNFYEKLYGDHPYAHPTDGTPESIEAMSTKDLKDFYQKAYTSKNVVIAIVGDLSRQEAEKIAEQISVVLPKAEALPVAAQPKAPKAGKFHIEFPSQQTHIVLGQLGIERNSPDYAALYLGNQILGGSGLSSRLMLEIRERRGLTYGIYSSFSSMQVEGPFSINLQTRAEMTEGALALIKDQVRQYLKEGPTQKELNDAKREMAGSFPLSNANNGNIVGQLGAIGFYNLPLNYLQDFVDDIQELTVKQVKEAMNKHLNVDQFIVVTVGPTVAQKPLPAPTEKSKATEPTIPRH